MPGQADIYEQDFVRWSEEQVSALRAAGVARPNLPLDWDHLAEEIDALGKSVRSELRSRLATIIEHLFKLEISNAVDPRPGWIETLRRERIEVEVLLDDNPSLRSGLSDSLDAADRKARKLARLGLERFGEWDPNTRRALDETRFPEREVLDLDGGMFTEFE